jgi:hypothetical protein
MRTPHRRPLPTIRLLLSLGLAVVTAVTVALVGPASSSDAASSTLSNGCAVSARGIPSCGAYVGAAYGSNTDPASWESSMGRTLGVHRTYWSSSQVAGAVKSATTDAAKHRIPWMSFKVPYSWKDMAAGKGDAWAKDLATRMKSTGGPVWIAMVHEPENDGGDIQQWKAMQAHLAPIMRAAAPNLGYSIILMGYHEFHGDAKYAMSAIWPNTKIDVAGFDIYETYGAKNSVWKAFDTNYYQPLQAWSKKTGVPWGLAETGFSDGAARAKSTWMSTTYNQMVARGGIAFSYFNTNLNSTTNWKLSFAAKQNQFTGIIKSAPTMR